MAERQVLPRVDWPVGEFQAQEAVNSSVVALVGPWVVDLVLGQAASPVDKQVVVMEEGLVGLRVAT
jgi:hypothetical protein